MKRFPAERVCDCPSTVIIQLTDKNKLTIINHSKKLIISHFSIKRL
jgi:hypothetical protein